VYGVVGVYAAVVHSLVKELNERRWPFALAVIALAAAIFVLGIAQQRYGRTLARRFVRRPPPQPRL
jgi:histidinol-phosphate/aromatic aminotransferase/cobyric acid decarboxylase-like protein